MNGLGHAQAWWADLDKVRPVVVLTRARVAPRLHRVLVAPVTTTARGLATEVTVGAAEGVRDGSVASLDNVQLVPVTWLLRRAGRIPPGLNYLIDGDLAPEPMVDHPSERAEALRRYHATKSPAGRGT